MRRTFEDLRRAAQVGDIVARSITAHAPEVMQRHYSTVGAEEQRTAVAKVVSLAGFREALALAGTASVGGAGGVQGGGRDHVSEAPAQVVSDEHAASA